MDCCSRTSAAPGRRNLRTTSPCTSSASGSATRSPSLSSTTYRSPTTTSQKRCKKRCSNPPFCLARSRKPGWPKTRKPPVLQGDASGCDHLRDGQVPPAGIEQSENSPRRVTKSGTGAAKSAAVGDDLPPITLDLAQVIEAWPTLPPAIREAILVMLRAAK